MTVPFISVYIYVNMFYLKFREYLAQKEGELRLRGAIQPTEYGQTQVMNQPITEQPEVGQPITAALGAGRIAELKSQLHKNKVDPDTFIHVLCTYIKIYNIFGKD